MSWVLCDEPHSSCSMVKSIQSKYKRYISVPYTQLLAPINSFLQCETPDSWVEEAKKPENLSMILRDHLACEQ